MGGVFVGAMTNKKDSAPRFVETDYCTEDWLGTPPRSKVGTDL